MAAVIWRAIWFASFEVPHPPNTWDECPDEWIPRFSNLDIPESPNANDPNRIAGARRQDDGWFVENWFSRQEERRRVYYLMTAVLDHNVGRILAALDAGLS